MAVEVCIYGEFRSCCYDNTILEKRLLLSQASDVSTAMSAWSSFCGVEPDDQDEHVHAVYNDVRAGASASKRVTITNTGSASCYLLAANHRNRCQSVQHPERARHATDAEPANRSICRLSLTPSERRRIKTAQLRIKSNDPNKPAKYVYLRGLATTGLADQRTVVATYIGFV